MNKTAEEACKGSAAKLQWASNVVEQWWNSGGTVPFFRDWGSWTHEKDKPPHSETFT